MIRTVRKVLSPLLKEQVLDDESLASLFCVVEQIINGRPLTAVSDDTRDIIALSPSHILTPGTPYQLPPGVFNSKDNYVRRHWRQVQYFSHVLWKRWTREYLPTLQGRHKWLDKKPNVSTGDIVLLVEETSRNHWPLARIIDVFPGDDGNVRSVRVKTQTSILDRPITKICLLEGSQQ